MEIMYADEDTSCKLTAFGTRLRLRWLRAWMKMYTLETLCNPESNEKNSRRCEIAVILVQYQMSFEIRNTTSFFLSMYVSLK
jgi:hypothetical protein